MCSVCVRGSESLTTCHRRRTNPELRCQPGFLQMLLNNGELDGTRLLGRKTIELMTSDHLGPIGGALDLLPDGYGFGLGFAVRLQPGIAVMPGSTGQYYWSGAAGTSFWVDPAERLFAVLMIQAPGPREHYRVLFRDLVYSAIVD